MAELAEIVQDAIKLEQDGEQYYEMAAKKALNPLARNTFSALAKDERAHAALVQAYWDALSEGGLPPTPQSIDERDYSLSATAKEIFEKAKQELAEGVSLVPEDLSELYDHAMEMERKSIVLYQQGAEQADGPEARELFDYLVEQERGHLKLLTNGQQYLDDPASWYLQEEQWSLEG